MLRKLKRNVKEFFSLVSCCQQVISFPGRTFLGKRRCFSGIAALTPLTPLTYKQNAVNAFILTKKTPLTPLTPLAFRLNAVNAVIPEKTCVYKKSDFLPP